ncbi:alpha/beta hydrolase fold [Seminavis robusta]|uniref:Alpha/beta hydrolase fold n=1 Tax=Seminavis robusta TaxID=568900 RepID=A0A9N8E6Q3_9STRA|nr:alpha/beta hydrolase fold [Seminavis robusta]|eukprot:Sro733_g194520.1 alpha/beta hydrolase fold (341) ;mRNA; r:13582-14693
MGMRRKIEGVLGGKLLNFAGRKFVKDAELIKREVFLPETGLTVHYYEREGDGTSRDESTPQPTLLLLHGITDEAKNMAALVIVLRKELPHWRIIVPDLIGHGHDLARAKKEGSSFEYPTPERLLQCMTEFVTALNIQQCTAFGMSMGGALAYFLQSEKPEVVQNTILISPALNAVLDSQFIQDFVTRQKNHFCYECRDDVKYFFRDLSCPHRKVKDPVPKFLLEAIWKQRLAQAPEGHFHSLFEHLLKEREKEHEIWHCSSDIAPEAKKLVIWPQNDFIANHDQGQAFFAKSSDKTTFHSVPDCGHLFHSNGKNVMEIAAPLMVDFLKQTELDGYGITKG